MPVLDRALQLQAASENPLATMARMRQDAADRQRRDQLLGVQVEGQRKQNELADLNIQAKRKDMADNENLTPLYGEWTGAAGNPEKQKAILAKINAIDPQAGAAITEQQLNAQKQQMLMEEKQIGMREQSLKIAERYKAMSDAKKDEARRNAAELAAKAQYYKKLGPEAWGKAGFDVPYEDADKVISKGQFVKGIFEWVDMADEKQKTSMKEAEARFYAETFGISMSEAVEYANSQNDAELRTRIQNTVSAQGLEGKELDDEVDRRFRQVKKTRKIQKSGAGESATDSTDPLGLGL